MISKENIQLGKQIRSDLNKLLYNEIAKGKVKMSHYGNKTEVDILKVNYSQKDPLLIISITTKNSHSKTERLRDCIYFDYKGVCSTYNDHHTKHYFWPVHMNNAEYNYYNIWEVKKCFY